MKARIIEGWNKYCRCSLSAYTICVSEYLVQSESGLHIHAFFNRK